MITTLILGGVLGAGALIASSAFGVSQSLGELWSRHRVDPDAAPAWFDLDELDPRGKPGTVFEKVGAIPLKVSSGVISGVMATRPVADVFDGSEFSKDLAVVGKDRVDFAAHALVKVAIVLGLGATIAFSSDSGRLAPSRIVALTIGAAALVVLVEVQGIQKQAKRRRIEILEAVTAFVEFTRLAAHTQTVEGAMRASVKMGASWPFRRLETIFEQAARHREAPWRGITAMGHSYGMLELVELGGALENAGVEGTRVQAMLAAKATSLRRSMTEAEIQRANASTQQLSVPLGLLGVVLVAVLLTPALLAF